MISTGMMKLAIFCIAIKIISGQMMSPCPTLFNYERNNNENDRWYGNVILSSDAELSGIWIKLIFDKPSVQLGNWFGEVDTNDNQVFLIKNPNHTLKANVPKKVRFFIRYDPYEQDAPLLMNYILNGRTLCPDTSQSAQNQIRAEPLFTSKVLAPPPRSNQQDLSPDDVRSLRREGTNKGNNRCDGGLPNFNEDNDDDFPSNLPAKPNNIFGRNTEKREIKCGTVATQALPLITNGQLTDIAEFPWHAALYEMKGMDYIYFCGGSLISNQHVITVAHCITVKETNRILEPASLVVYLGKNYLKRWTNPGILERHVNSIRVHPKYNPSTFSNDIAIIRLSKLVDMSDYVRPICLWEGDQNLQSIVGKLGTVVGWGFDNNYRKMQQLIKASVPVVSQQTCLNSYKEFYSRYTSNNTFCGGFRNGTSMCNGDSGGGMVFPTKAPNSESEIWHLRGLISISVDSKNYLNCVTSHFIVFTDTAKYLNWIRDSMK